MTVIMWVPDMIYQTDITIHFFHVYLFCVFNIDIQNSIIHYKLLLPLNMNTK